MASAKFETIFGEYLDNPAEFNGVEIIHCNISEDRRLECGLYSPKYIPLEAFNEAKQGLKTALQLEAVNFTYTFEGDSFSIQSCNDLVSIIKQKNVLINGFFNGAAYTLDGNKINIELVNGGYETIKEADFEKKFNNLAFDMFKRKFEITFSGQLQNIELKKERVERQQPEKEKEKEIEYNYKPKDNLPVYLESAKPFYGGRLDKNVKPIIDIRPPENAEEKKKISAWGEVFGVEEKNINTRKGPMVLYKFFFSDTTNSLKAKLFVDKDKASSLKPLENGTYVIVNGDFVYDKWSGDFEVKVSSLASLVRYEETDTYEGEKRIELHCHTNMSDNDAVSSAADIINQAYRWGHKAIAITDHGVLQAYPEAASAVGKIRKAGGGFKVIYGVEGYFANDTKGITDITKLNRYHQIILVKNAVGLKNLYKIVSSAHIDNFYKRPLSFKSVIDAHREGLILGSACEQGELYRAIIEGKSKEELNEIASYYDYLEIQPVSNNDFMLRRANEVEYDKKTNAVKENIFKNVTSVEVIKDFNRKVVEIGDRLGIPVVATGDVHFLKKEDEIIRKILLAGKDFDDFDQQPPLYLKTTQEMLDDFDYFGDRAREFVIDNPQKIADMIEADVSPVPKGNYPPVIEGSDELLNNICWDRANKMYNHEGKLPEVVKKRLEKELNAIINNGFSIMYIAAQKLVAFSEENGYLVGSRGSVGSSFAATMAGISEVNPLPPHYYCPNCQHSEFFTKGEVGSGFDLPSKNCPICDNEYARDGHDIPFETFLGFKGDKVPDIDLNFSDEFQLEVQKYTETLFGPENVYKAGTVSTVAEKTAFGFSKAYAEKKGIVLSSAELNRLATKVESANIKTTTGQHPAGMIIVPRDKEIYDFCPVQHPANKKESGITTTHFDFHAIHDTILKLDELGHVVPTTYKYLEAYTGIPVTDISMSDKNVYSLFVSPKALGVDEEQIYSKTGTYCLPEFGTKFVREMLVDCQPKNFSDLLQISGLSHGTDVWLGNAKDLIDSGTCTISEVIGTRDNIMVYLIHKGMEEGQAFKITETVRKGLVAKGAVSPDEWGAMEKDMRSVGVPQWYINSCHKIKYMFPKAHATAYVIGALRLAWYKIYKPLEFYCAYFTARPEDIDVPVIMKGKDAVKNYLKTIKENKDATQKELDVYENMLIINEMLERGIEILPIDIEHSHSVKFLPENGRMRLPFFALSGVGRKAAISLYEAAQEGNFISKEEFQTKASVSKPLVDRLRELGALGSLPDTNQISMF